jgi:hypothetical protein
VGYILGPLGGYIPQVRGDGKRKVVRLGRALVWPVLANDDTGEGARATKMIENARWFDSDGRWYGPSSLTMTFAWNWS